MATEIRVLCVQKSDQEVEEIALQLQRAGFAPVCRHVSTQNDAHRAIVAESWDLILASYSLDQFDILTLLDERESRGLHTPVLVFSDPVGDERVATALRLGAADFIVRGNWTRLVTAVRRELQRSATQAERRRAADARLSAHAAMEHELEKRNKELHKLNAMLRDEIAVRRQAEESIRESEARFRSMADGLPQSVWVHKADGSQAFVNKTFCEFFGVEPEETIGGQWQALVHPDDAEAYISEFIACTHERRLFHAQARVKDAKGDWRWIESWGRPRLSDSGAYLGFIGSSIDITSRIQAEQALRENERFLRSLLESSLNGLYIFDLRTQRNVYINPAYTLLTGYSIDDFNAMNDAELLGLFHPDDLPRVIQHLQDVVATSEAIVLDIEYRFKTADGRWIWCLSRDHTYVWDENGAPAQMIGTFLDITERKKIEDDLRQSEARYRMLHESLRDAFVQVTMDGRIIECNEVYCQLLGYSCEELSTMSYQDLTPDRWHVIEERILRDQILMRGYSDVYEKEYRRKDGSLVPIELRSTLSRDAEGRPNAMWAIVRDITERKRFESYLKETTQRLEAHLANSPLAIIEFGSDFSIIRWSSEAEKTFGWSADEVIGKKIGDFAWVHEDDTDRVAYISKAMLSGSSARNRHVNRNYRKDGTVIHCEWYNSAIRSDDGKLLSIFSQVLDITDRKRAEEALLESEKRFCALADGTPIIIWTCDITARNQFVNRAWSEFFGVSEEVARSGEWQPLVHPDDLDQYAGAFFEAIRNKSRSTVQARVRRHDGQWRWIESYAEPRVSPSGEFLGLTGSTIDITERKQAEERLRFQARLLDLTGQAIIVTDRHGTISYLNARAEQMFGWSARDAEGQNDPEIACTELDLDRKPEIKEKIQANESWSGEIQCHHRDGSPVSAWFTITPLHGDSGELFGMIAIAMDLSESNPFSTTPSQRGASQS